MKRIYSITYILGIFFLVGCSGNNLTATQIVEENAPIIKASKEIDDGLTNSIKDVEIKIDEMEEQQMEQENGIEEEEIKESPYQEIMAGIWSAREAQKDLYEKINNQQVPTKFNKLKYKYLSLIDNRIGNYDLMYDFSNNESHESILQVVENNEITSKQIEEQLLITINTVLEEDGGKKIDGLYAKGKK